VQMRLAKWYFTIEAGQQSWLFGTGTGDDEDALLDTYKKNNFKEGYIPRFNAHNQFLQTWLGLGIIGLIILILNLFIPLFLAFKERNLYYCIFLILIISFCLTESVLCRQHGVVFYSFFNSLFAFHSLKKNL
jgi:O-antigen ligase